MSGPDKFALAALAAGVGAAGFNLTPGGGAMRALNHPQSLSLTASIQTLPGT